MKRPSLADNVKAAAATAEAEPMRQPAAKRAPAHKVPAPGNDAGAGEAKRGGSREGRKAIYAWVDPAEHLKLKRLSLDTNRSIDSLVTEGVSLLFAEYGVPEKS